jgi:hypothetical protein
MGQLQSLTVELSTSKAQHPVDLAARFCHCELVIFRSGHVWPQAAKNCSVTFFNPKGLDHNNTKPRCLYKHPASPTGQAVAGGPISLLSQPLFIRWQTGKQIRREVWHNYCFKACQTNSAVNIAALLTTFLETCE